MCRKFDLMLREDGEMFHCTYIICKKCGKKFSVMDGGVILDTGAANRLLNRICPACEHKILMENFKRRKSLLLRKLKK